MKIIIDIPEEAYKHIEESGRVWLISVIKQGTVVEEGDRKEQ